MQIVLQICKQASVKVDNQIVGSIDRGYLLLVGIEKDDDEQTLSKFANKIVNMRINKDEQGKTNLSILDVKGKILSVSQFTLCADIKKRRPSFSIGADPIKANEYYQKFNIMLEQLGLEVKTGIFGAEMEVSLINDGPFTIIMNNSNI